MRLFLLLSALLVSALASADLIYGDYQPTGIIKDLSPTVTWKVAPTPGNKIDGVELSLNGKSVKAVYDEKTHAVIYTPPAALDAGLYRVTCRATIPGKVTARQDWSFEVSGGESNNASFASMLAFNEANLIRQELGLPMFSQDQRITDAAMAHSRYMSFNGACGHVEESGKSGFTGTQPWDRVAAYGYKGPCYEDACLGKDDPKEAIRLLFNAPYHRIAFLQPGAVRLGAGMVDGALTADFTVSTQSGVGMSPARGQKGIPTTWDGNESPNPLRLHSPQGSVGYPIVFGYYSPRMEPISITSFELRDCEGNLVSAFLNTPANDNMLRFNAVLIPSRPLVPEEIYEVRVAGKTASGKSIDTNWKFTTAAK